MRLISLAILLAVCCLVPATGFAGTTLVGAPCRASIDGNVSFTVFEGNAETTINGDLVEAPLTTSLGVCTAPGYVAIFENANGSLTDPSTWSDLAYFDGAGNVTMYSDPPPTGVTNWQVSVADKGVFENSLGQGIYSAQTFGTVQVCSEDPTDPAKFICTHIVVGTTYDYTFVSDSPVSGEDELPAAPGPVPEPMTLSLLGTGMLGVVGVVRRKWLG
jgi:PEP-CTERM motif